MLADFRKKTMIGRDTLPTAPGFFDTIPSERKFQIQNFKFQINKGPETF
jgi:hypothetical protein